jgi:hypothetical protein
VYKQSNCVFLDNALQRELGRTLGLGDLNSISFNSEGIDGRFAPYPSERGCGPPANVFVWWSLETQTSSDGTLFPDGKGSFEEGSPRRQRASKLRVGPVLFCVNRRIYFGAAVGRADQPGPVAACQGSRRLVMQLSAEDRRR